LKEYSFMGIEGSFRFLSYCNIEKNINEEQIRTITKKWLFLDKAPQKMSDFLILKITELFVKLAKNLKVKTEKNIIPTLKSIQS